MYRLDRLLVLVTALILAGTAVGLGAERNRDAFDRLRVEYDRDIRPMVKGFCLDCHATDVKEGELDLERFANLDDVRHDPPTWQKVAQMLATGEMPPEDEPQPSGEEKKQLQDWVRRYLDAEALASAGDPGPVVLRRLNNAEYTYTIRDLTGADLDPAREFPVDGAAGEGFTNTGNALAMSPALVQKYLDAARQVADHAVLLPDGFRFSTGETRRDWSNEIVAEIRAIYARHTSGNSDVSRLDKWSEDPTKATLNDGRVPITDYFAALIRNREALLNDLDSVDTIAGKERLNAKYLRHLATMLVSNEPQSPQFDRLRRQWRQATPDDAGALAAEVRAWQDQLWKFNPVGHLGMVQPWQVPVSPLADAQTFRVKIEPPSPGDDVILYLAAGTAGDGDESDTVIWKSPRVEVAGRPPILLRDLRATSYLLEAKRRHALTATKRYLAAAFTARQQAETENQGDPDIDALAMRYEVETGQLKAWLAFLGISADRDVTIDDYLHHRIDEAGGYNFVKGWGLPGVSALSLMANTSDNKVNIPGDAEPHKIVVHPRPERWVAAGWKSPVDAIVQLAPHVQHAHNACGNGVSWSLERRRGSQRQVLADGHVDRGGRADIEALTDIPVRKGDLVSLVIGPRDANHGCDLTQIDLAIAESTDPQREWSLSGDCADSIDAGNPHTDRLGNQNVWHFYTGMIEGELADRVIPPGSLLARWIDSAEADVAERLAADIERLISKPLTADTPPADTALYHQLTGWNGPLFSKLAATDFAAVAASLSSDEWKMSRFGLDPARFGRTPDGAEVAAEDLVVRAPSLVEIRLPAGLYSGAELVVAGTLFGNANDGGSVQVQVTASRPADLEDLQPAVPVVVRPNGQAEARFQQAFDAFRSLFPAAMCHARIVPVDEVVTLLLYHREDEHLARLMLDDQQAQQLDRLWDELRYVSQDALRLVTALEQLLEFATQDADPSRFDPVLEPIREGAEAFRRRLVETEPAHLDALIEFAARAWRRPLTEEDSAGLRGLYQSLRDEPLPHDEALRMCLARVLASPAFLYRLEQPAAGERPGPVSDLELANRLSYFLWSSMPDGELRRVASEGLLHEPETLVAQTRRLLKDRRARRLAIEFAGQWLHIRDFDQLEKSERHFSTFAAVQGDMYEESIRFFTDLFQNDGSLLSILDADHTFLNARLAEHYGIASVTGDEWQRVDGVGKHFRGGVLRQATVLAKQSGASRTSPILRGNWVSETLLGERLPRPPKDVPLLAEAVPDGLSERQLIERHTSDAACAKCHARIDPYGFALESYDAIGRFRRQDLAGRPIDTRTTLADGTTIEGVEGLTNYILNERREAFLGQFCRKLLGYALGRAVQLSDKPLLDKINSDLAAGEYRFSAAVEAVVLSDQFRKIRGREE